MQTNTNIIIKQDWTDPHNPTLRVDNDDDGYTFGLRHDEKYGTLVTIKQNGAPAPGGWSADTVARHTKGARFCLDSGAGWYIPADVTEAWSTWLNYLGYGLEVAA